MNSDSDDGTPATSALKRRSTSCSWPCVSPTTVTFTPAGGTTSTSVSSALSSSVAAVISLSHTATGKVRGSSAGGACDAVSSAAPRATTHSGVSRPSAGHCTGCTSGASSALMAAKRARRECESALDSGASRRDACPRPRSRLFDTNQRSLRSRHTAASVLARSGQCRHSSSAAQRALTHRRSAMLAAQQPLVCGSARVASVRSRGRARGRAAASATVASAVLGAPCQRCRTFCALWPPGAASLTRASRTRARRS
jgi:hypothetical protein